MTGDRNYPIRVRVEERGYNYIKCFGKLLFEETFFKEATTFDENGYAEVVMTSGERKKIDRNGNFC